MKKLLLLQAFWVHSYTTKDAKVEKGVQLYFSFPSNILSNKVKKVCYKITFMNIQFIM